MLADNEKVLAEVREKEEPKVQVRPNEADIFSERLNYAKKLKRKIAATKKVE